MRPSLDTAACAAALVGLGWLLLPPLLRGILGTLLSATAIALAAYAAFVGLLLHR